MQTALPLSPSHEQSFKEGVEHLLAGRAAEAEAVYRHLLGQRPDMAPVHHNLALALKAQKKPADAVAGFRQALAIRPTYAEAYNNLGDTLREMNQLEEALEALQSALVLRPDFPEALSNMGMVLRGLNRLPEAIDAYQRALSQRPGFAEAWSNMGNTLREMNRLDQALDAYQHALSFKPAYAEAWNNLGGTLRQLGRHKEAADAYRRAISLRPTYAEAWSNLGIVLCDTYQASEAIEVLRRSLALQDNLPETWTNLAVAFKETGHLDQSMACYARVVQLLPNKAEAASGRLCTLHYHPSFDAAANFRELRQWNDRFVRPLAVEIRACDNDASPNRRLRIGYVSPDLRGHCQSLFTSPLLAHHGHGQFEIVCYANVQGPDAVTTRLQSYADRWRDISRQSDQEVCRQIRQDQIDILVDLALHTAGNRLGVFARKSAPIQVTWLGYPGTTGMDTIDYRLTDPWLDPPPEGTPEVLPEVSPEDTADSLRPRKSLAVPRAWGVRYPCYSEKSIYLSSGYWCYDPRGMDLDQQAKLPQPGPLPAQANGYVTFGCLNNFCKVTDVTLSLWKQVLAAVGGSRLIMVAPPGPHRQEVIQKLGVTADRVEFVVYQPREQYLETYRRIDLCLDTLPFNGGTTSLDGLWMGVPVLTRVGRTVVGRAGSSHLHRLGLEELIAGTDDEFVAKAVSWTKDPEKQSQLRQSLRGRMEGSSLMDGKGFAQAMEKAYRQMWLAWCRKSV